MTATDDLIRWDDDLVSALVWSSETNSEPAEVLEAQDDPNGRERASRKLYGTPTGHQDVGVAWLHRQVATVKADRRRRGLPETDDVHAVDSYVDICSIRLP